MPIQRQDLTVFSDNTLLSPHLFDNESHFMLLICYRLGTSPSWLIMALIEALVFGSPSSITDQAISIDPKPVDSPVTIFSFINGIDVFIQSLSKLKIPSSKCRIIDVIEELANQREGKKVGDIFNSLLSQVNTIGGSTLILELPELLIPLLNISSDELHLKFIQPLRKRFDLMIVITNMDTFDSDPTCYLSQDSIELNKFPITCFHKSIGILNLKPLDSGRANDVTGSISVRRGGTYIETLPVSIIENEYLYFTQRDCTKLFYR